MSNRILQIGVIGSMADLNYSANLVKLAQEVGAQIAKAGYTLVFGAEKDFDSLSTIAARSAVVAGGVTVGVTYDKGLRVFDPNSATIIIATGLVRGGGREMVQSLSCDGIIAISGGSGTLNELAVAYQASIPAVVLGKTGWSGKLIGTYLDGRKRYKYESASTATDALTKLLKMVN
ncbi:MAG TPA: hypothetical protein PKB09_01505 [Candidatus Saccharibacteria bacterium]|nr:hypothetical protein [Candidatus Saccharibacteria bacterium]